MNLYFFMQNVKYANTPSLGTDIVQYFVQIHTKNADISYRWGKKSMLFYSINLCWSYVRLPYYVQVVQLAASKATTIF